MTILQSWPEHQNPSPNRRDRIASAPYNFVPLPEKIITAVDKADDLPDHNKYYPDCHSGYFDVMLTTRSPLYIRGPITAKDLPRQDEKAVKDNPAFFHTGDERRPVIPGSSLRGMLRSVLEIASYGKMQWVSEKQLFFRTVDYTTIGEYYRSRMNTRVETGFLIRRDNTYYIKVCPMARVWRSKILYNATGPNQVPPWQGQPRQYTPVWVSIKSGGTGKPDIVQGLSYQERDGMIKGCLVITGNAPRKKKEFVFLLSADNDEEITISDDIISRFHDDDQITQWQEAAFPTNQPAPKYREQKGMLGNAPTAPGDPIFFLRENGKLTFIGRARMFRLPYKQRPIDLVPSELRRATDIDYAEAMFGFVRNPQQFEELKGKVRQGKKGRAYAGRVTVTDALLQPDQENTWLAGDFNKEITPKILATPKPTTFQHYLTQQHPDDPGKLDHYDSKPPESDETTIRGHKLYWHQGLGTDQDLGMDQGLTLEQIRAVIAENPAKLAPRDKDTQHTRFKPLMPGIQFSFRVYFENLSKRELGALCWTLHPRGEQGRRYCHHLGMGKPLGMGAVELHAHLHIIDRSVRYKHLFNESNDNWQSGEASTVENLADSNVLECLTQPFEQHLLHELNPDPPCTRLADIRRIAMLLKLLEWPGYRAEKDGDLYLTAKGRPNTRYMELKEYQGRPVLPDPTGFESLYFKDKSHPQVPQTSSEKQAPAEKDIALPVLTPELAEQFYVGREVTNLNKFTQTERGLEVPFWRWSTTQVIGFLPKELIDRPLGPKISVVITGLRQEPNGRLIVELKLRPKR